MAGPDWLFERPTARGTVRIGIQGTRYQAELNGRLLKLASNDIVRLDDLAASRHTAHLVKPLRDGGYTHLLGGTVGLLAEEARMLHNVATGTREGLRFLRARLVEALERERAQRAIDGDRQATPDSGIVHHADDRESQVTPARQRLLDFDRRHPKILAELQAKGE